MILGVLIMAQFCVEGRHVGGAGMSAKGWRGRPPVVEHAAAKSESTARRALTRRIVSSALVSLPTPDLIASWLARDDVRAHDPARVEALLRALPDRPHMMVRRYGAVVCYAPDLARRRLLELDRRGRVVEALAWTATGELRWAKCRMPDGRMLGIEPGAASHPGWGASDRLWLVADEPGWHPRQPLSIFQSVDWRRPGAIPPLADPAGLPAGAGTTVLNLLAAAMADQGVMRARYEGPYPTEALFTALLECFRHDASPPSPLEAFLAGDTLDWHPDPHERHHVAADVCVHLRAGIDKVVLAGVPFYRPDWHGAIRREPRVVRADGERVICSLWALGRPLEDRLILDRSGEVLEQPAPRRDGRPPAPLAPVWTAACADLIARESPPILAGPIGEALRAAALEWGDVPGDLLYLAGDRIRLSRALRDAGLAWVRDADDEDTRGRRAVHLALEVSRLLAPEIRRRAQRLLAALPVPEQQQRWEEAASASPPALTGSAGRLIALIMRGNA